MVRGSGGLGLAPGTEGVATWGPQTRQSCLRTWLEERPQCGGDNIGFPKCRVGPEL